MSKSRAKKTALRIKSVKGRRGKFWKQRLDSGDSSDQMPQSYDHQHEGKDTLNEVTTY